MRCALQELRSCRLGSPHSPQTVGPAPVRQNNGATRRNHTARSPPKARDRCCSRRGGGRNDRIGELARSAEALRPRPNYSPIDNGLRPGAHSFGSTRFAPVPRARRRTSPRSNRRGFRVKAATRSEIWMPLLGRRTPLGVRAMIVVFPRTRARRRRQVPLRRAPQRGLGSPGATLRVRWFAAWSSRWAAALTFSFPDRLIIGTLPSPALSPGGRHCPSSGSRSRLPVCRMRSASWPGPSPLLLVVMPSSTSGRWRRPDAWPARRACPSQLDCR